jgi:sugar (pentulose or hexulose) kinase
MMEKYAIGLDLGTSSVKAVLFSTEKGVVAKDSAKFTYAPAYLPDGSEYLGIDMEKFYRTICAVLQNLSKKVPNGASFGGIAMASASGNGVLCDKQGNALIDAYSWLTPAMSAEIATVFGADFGPEVREAAGWGLAPSFPLGQFAHLRVHAPELLDKADVVCMATEYVLHRLTGKWGIDVSTATPFYFLDQKKRVWNEEFLAALGIPASKLPELMESGDLLGEMTADGARDTGLPVGTHVHVGSFDHPTAARACNIEKQGDLLISCGTSWVCFFPMNDRAAIMARNLSSDPFLTPNGPWGTICSLARAGERIDELTARFFGDEPNMFVAFDEAAAKAPKGAEGLAFNPMEELPDLDGYSKENIARAIMEGVANALKNRMGDIVKVERITMCGGPSVSPVWPVVLADVFGVPVNVTYGPHSGAVGAAMYALK